jgi:5-methylcytosine-specific restriction endonuclease McrA
MFAMADHGTYSNYTNGGCRCDECRAANTAYKRSWGDPEKKREYYRKRYEANRDEMLEYFRNRYATNPDVAGKTRENARKRYEADPEKWMEEGRKWRATNPDKVRAYSLKGQQTRRARKLSAFVEDVDPQVVFERDSWTCHICGEAISTDLSHPDPMSASLDHIIPLAKGGEHSYANSGTSHLRCNQRKHTKVA